MFHRMTRLDAIAALAAVLVLSACATGTSEPQGGISVEGAFLSPNAIAVQPYTRTIFSSTNF